MQSTDVPVLRRAAMDFLARREHSRTELRQKILRKYPEIELQTLENVLSNLEEQKLQSDNRFAESFIRYRKSKGFGWAHIRADLMSRQVSWDIINNYLHRDDKEWGHIASKLTEKRLGKNRTLEYGSKTHQRFVRFMKTRGFSGTEIRNAIDKSMRLTITEGF